MSATANPQLREAQSLALAARIDPGITGKLSGEKAGAVARRLGFDSPSAALKAFHEAEANGLRSMRLEDMARESIARATGMSLDATFRLDPMKFMQAAFHSSSDFPLLLDNTANKVLMAQFEEAPIIWESIARRGIATDYKEASLNSLSEAPNFEIIPEGGTPSEGTFNERRETIRVDPFGKRFSFTYQMLRNDDLGAFAQWMQLMAIAARRVPDDALIALLELNAGLGPTMSDGKTFFHDDHNNIGTPGALDAATAKADWSLMRNQKGFGKDQAPLNLTPAVMLVPSALMWTAQDLAGQEYDLSTGDKNQKNPIRGRFTAKDSPRLSSDTRWWWFAAPGIAPAFEVRFLDGMDAPRISLLEMGNPLCQSFQATVFGFGIAPVQWEAGTTNAGTGG